MPDRPTNKFADPAEVRLGVRRQLIVRTATGDVFLPAGQRLVDRLRAAQVVDMAGEDRRSLAVDFVGRADLDFVEPAEHVEQHHGDRVDAAEPAGVAKRHGIEPAAAPRAARDGAVFVAAVAHVLASRVVLLGRERPAADARRVRLHDADDCDRCAAPARPNRWRCRRPSCCCW